VIHSLRTFQAAASVLCSLVSLAMLVLWRRIPAGHRANLWRQYGMFTGLSCVGSCVGAAYVVSSMVFLSSLYTAEDALIIQTETYVVRLRKYYSRASFAHAAELVAYGVQFAFVSIGKMLVLFRLLDFAAGIASLQRKDSLVRRLRIARALLFTVVFLCCLVGICSCIAGAALFGQLGALQIELANALENNSTVPEYGNLASRILDSASTSTGIAYFCEVVVLPLIICAFVVTGVLCLRIRVRSEAKNSEDEILVEHIKKQVVVTVSVVFVTFLLRAAFSALQAFAYADSQQPLSGACLPKPCDASCRSLGYVISEWMSYTPEFQCVSRL
jgi:hypothetical protein